MVYLWGKLVYRQGIMKFRLLTGLFLLSAALNLLWTARGAGWLTIPAMLAGWYLADMISGLVHMFMDYHPCPTGKGLDRLYFYEGSRESEEYQALFRGKMARLNPFQRLVYDFKNHHPRPHALGRRTMVRQIGSTIMAGSLPASLLFNLACIAWPVPGWLAAMFFTMLIGGTFAQYFHGTLHREQNPWIIRAMRQVRLLMTPQAHQLHHDSLKRDFSTNCGWSNPVVNWIFCLFYRTSLLEDRGLEPMREPTLN